MRVLIFHGYLLRGTGSNVYNASVAQALAKLGHEVHLLCQDREAAELDWVDAVGELGAGPGTVTVHLPDIGGLLPVYVADRYEGFEVKTFPELTDSELDGYVEANAEAVRGVAEGAGGVDAALANHLVMGPLVLARAGLGKAAGGPGYAVKIHGSALEFTVKPHPRFLAHAHEGLEGAAGVLVGSRHTAESLWAAMGDPELPSRTRLGPPGVDTELFARLAAGSHRDRLEALAADLRALPSDPAAAFARDPAEAAAAVEELAAARARRVAFVGKLIDTKGVDMLLAAWPLVVAADPGSRLLIAGFGEGRDRIERFAGALDRGDLEAAREATIAAPGETSWRYTRAFLTDPPPGYADLARQAAGSVSFGGRIEHDEVGRLVPACDVLVMPSTFPEAFGMVAAEAAAAGVLPVSAAHSGMLEVSRELAAALPDAAADLVSFELGDGAVRAIAGRICSWFALDEPTREEARAALAATAASRWSWEGVAEGVLAASAGDLETLIPVAGE
jgi:glycosyltransferase involved in cell wall biosynthesis